MMSLKLQENAVLKSEGEAKLLIISDVQIQCQWELSSKANNIEFFCIIYREQIILFYFVLFFFLQKLA